MQIELTRVILRPRLSDFLRNTTVHFCMFLYLVSLFLSHGFVAMPVTSKQAHGTEMAIFALKQTVDF